MNPTAVLPLGEEQMPDGTLSQFRQVYAPSWGRLLTVTHPVPGHRPRFSSSAASPSSERYIPSWNDLFAAGADIVLNGHAHDYERFRPQDAYGHATSAGIREYVVGTGGENFQTLGTALANTVVRNNRTFGVLKLTLAPTSYSWKFLSIAGSTFTDSGSATCHLK